MILPLEASGFSRRSFVKLLGATSAAAALTASLAACGTTDSSTTPTPAATGGTETSTAPDVSADAGGTINAGISYELGTNGYDPMTTTAALTVAANWHTMEGLTEIDPTPPERTTYAALGKELPTQVDDLTWEVTLRDGAKFSDGTDVTMDDVVFSFDRVLDPDNNSLYASFLPFLESVSPKDDKTVTIKTRYPFSLVADRIAVVKIVPKAIVEADPAAYDLDPIGTGPYRMTDNGAASQQVVFEKNEHYNGSKPALAAAMTWQILPDDSTRTNALTSGTVQAIDSVPAADLAGLAPNEVAAELGFGLVFAMFNHGYAPMDDPRNRQGVMWALDYEQICSVGMSDLATPATSFVQKEHPAYAPAKVIYTKDTDKAKALFAETGLTTVKVLATDHGFFSAARPIIKESLEAAGLTVEYEEKKSADVYATIDSEPDAYQVMFAPGDPSVFGDDAGLLLSWWYAADVWTDNRMHWMGSDSYAQVQDLLAKADAATGEEQLDLWHQVFDIVSEVLPMYPIFHRKTPTGWDGETLVSFKPLAITGLSFLDVASTK